MFILLIECPIKIQTSVYQKIPFFSDVNYIAQYFSENFEVLIKIKIKRNIISFKLFNFAY